MLGGGLDLKRLDHILIKVEGGTGTKKKKNCVPTPFCEKPPSNEDGFSQKGAGRRFFLVPVPPPTLINI